MTTLPSSCLLSRPHGDLLPMIPLLRALPLPRSGRVRHVIHLADVHIPFLRALASSPANASAHWKTTQHESVIDNLVKSVQQSAGVQEGTAVVLLAGDVLDCKHTANATTVMLLRRLIEGLCYHGTPVYITPGNHDLALDKQTCSLYEQQHASDQGGEGALSLSAHALTSRTTQTTQTRDDDLLGELVKPLHDGLPVAYLNATGVYGTPGSGALFGVLHVRDASVPGNCSGDVRCVEDMPLHLLSLESHGETLAELKKTHDDVAVFVFHGQVSGYRTLSSTHNEHVDRGHAPSIPRIARSCGYDVGMFGDIHTMQLHGVRHVPESNNPAEQLASERSQTGGRATFEHADERGAPSLVAGKFTWAHHNDDGGGAEGNSAVTLSRDAFRGSRAKRPGKNTKTQQQQESPLQGRRDVPWGYAGSLLQLNAGERLFPHGYLEWDLLERRVSCHHVINPYGILFVSGQDRDAMLLHNAVTPVCDPGVPVPVSIANVASDPWWRSWMPIHAVVRVLGGGVLTTSHMESVRSALRRCFGIQAIGHNAASSSAYGKLGSGALPTTSPSSDSPSVTRSEIVAEGLTERVDLSQFGRVDSWVEYVRDLVPVSDDDEQNEEERRAWETWLRDPRGMRVPEDGLEKLPPALVTKAKDRNAKIERKCDDAKSRMEGDGVSSSNGGSETAALSRPSSSSDPSSRTNGSARSRFSLRRLRWAWMLCYGPDNMFDFSSMDGKVALLSAPNGRGKSSMLEVLCVALYGHPMASRGGKGSLADAINRERRLHKDAGPAFCAVDVEVEGEGVFRVSRTLNVSGSSSSASARVSATSRVSKLVPPNDTLVTVKDGATATNAWVASHLGTLSGFLLCSLLTQGGDADFFSMKSQEQKALLDDALALEAARAMTDVLKEARLAHAFLSDAVHSSIEGAKSSRPTMDDSVSIADLESAIRQMECERERIEDRLSLVTVRHQNADASSRALKAVLRQHDVVVLEEEERVEKEKEGTSDDDEIDPALLECPISVEHLKRSEDDAARMEERWPDEARTLVRDVRDDLVTAAPESTESELRTAAMALCDKFRARERDCANELEKSERRRIHADMRLEAAEETVSSLLSADPIEEVGVSGRAAAPFALSSGKVCSSSIEADKFLTELSELADLLRSRRPDDSEAQSAVRDDVRRSPSADENAEEGASLLDRAYETANTEFYNAKRARELLAEATSKSSAERARANEASESLRRIEIDVCSRHIPVDPQDTSSVALKDVEIDFVRESTAWRSLRDALVGELRAKEAACSCPALADALRELDKSIAASAISCHRKEGGTDMDWVTEPVESAYDDIYRAMHDVLTAMAKRDRLRLMKMDREITCRDPAFYNPGCRACVAREELRESLMREFSAGSMTADRPLRIDDDPRLPRHGEYLRAEDLEPLIREWRTMELSFSTGSKTRLVRWARACAAEAERSAKEGESEVERLRIACTDARERAKASKAVYTHMLHEEEERQQRATERVKQADVEGEDGSLLCESAVRDEHERLRAWAVARKELEDAQERAMRVRETRESVQNFREEQRERSEECAAKRRALHEASERRCRMESFAHSVTDAESDWRRSRSWTKEARRSLVVWRSRASRAARRSEVLVKTLGSEADSLKGAFSSVATRIARAGADLESARAWLQQHRDWCAYRDAVEIRKARIEKLCAVMDGFSAWVYSHRALPAITNEVNALLALMGTDIHLGAACREEDGGSLSWTMNGTPISKCSGMQRFATSLAMRVALSQLGASSATCAQLIIDEGFVTLDAENIARVPEFLQEGIVGTGRYAGVLLVSHLDGVREAADVIAPIAHDPERRLSRLWFQ